MKSNKSEIYSAKYNKTYEEMKVVLESNGYFDWYHIDNWVAPESKSNPDRAGSSTVACFESIMKKQEAKKFIEAKLKSIQ